MAAVSSASENATPASKTVLRVKRKRTEDPADLLLVSHALKKSIKEADIRNHKLETPVQRLFRFAGTLSQQEHSLSPDILNNLKSNQEHKSKVKMTPQTSLTVESINKKLRQTKQLSSQRSRYKVVLKNREEQEDASQPAPDDDEDSDAATKEQVQKLFQMYDAVLDETQEPDTKKREEKEAIYQDENAILCNSVKMIREKLTLKDEQTKNLERLEGDYVYDVYCAEDNFGGLSEMLDIVRLNECELMLPEIDDELSQYDDDDDSNDENNWRNDYPDEDEWSQSSGELPTRYKSEHFDYGWQDPDGQAYGGKMFADNLSSDEEKDYAYFGQKFNDCGRDTKDNYNCEVISDEDD